MSAEYSTGTKELLLKTLKERNCTPDDKGDDTYGIRYDDAYITIQVNEKMHSLTLYDLHWYRVSEYDIEKLSSVMKEINRINLLGWVKMVYSKFDDDYIYISSSRTSPFVEDIPNPGDYLAHELKQLLSYRNTFKENKKVETEE